MVEMVTVQIASIPDRVEMLGKVIESLLPQVDKLNVFLNLYPSTPECCMVGGVRFTHLDNEKGDAAKIYGLKDIKGYIFLCDDDLLYPPDYVENMVNKLQAYNNAIILTNHGRIMREKPVGNSYTDRVAAYRCREKETYEGYLDIGGTGVMAWHSSCFFPDYNRVTKRNMLDIWIAKFAKEQKVNIIHNPHEPIQYLHPKKTIWDEAYYHPDEQTDLYNSF